MSWSLLLGFAVAGLLSVFISATWLERHLGGRGLAPVWKASLFGVPLPLCSCGVIPVSASLRQHGASRAATTAFLLSTPQTGVDSVMVTWTLLGPLFAIFRPVIALLTGILGGSLVQVVVPPENDRHSQAKIDDAAVGADDLVGGRARIAAAFHYATVTLPGDIGRALLIGVLLAGLIATMVPDHFLDAYLGSGLLSILLMMAVGMPLYVCATASVPLAAGFIAMGASPGAALAFLVAGPATNAATVTTISRVLGRRTLMVYLVSVAISAVGGGLLLDWLWPRVAATVPMLSGAGHVHHDLNGMNTLAGVILMGVLIWSWWSTRHHDHGAPGHETGADRAELSVVGMKCSHCVSSVERAIVEVPGVRSCTAELDSGRVVVSGTALDPVALSGAVSALGYEVTDGGLVAGR